MRKLFVFAIAVMTVLAGKAQTVAPDSEGMTRSAQEWTRDVVMGWNLGNSFECPNNETEWGNPKTTREMIHAVAEAGFNAIRIPVRWINHVNNTTDMTIYPIWLDRVKEVVDWCLEENMYVIINTHHEEWLDRNPFYSKQEENNRRLAAIWTQVATYFRDYDQRLVFAGTNETTVNWAAPNAEQQAVQNSYNQTFVDAVRETGGKNYYRNLVVQTFACSPYHGLDGFTIPSDKVEGRLSVEFHYYDPYEYCLGCTYYYWGEAYRNKGRIPGSTESTLTSLFDRITKAWVSKGLGVVLGEYGVSNHYTDNDKQTQMENMQYYLTCVTSEARKHGFAAFAWDNNAFNNGSENFGIFRRWQGMTVGNTYFLKGITEGAGAEFVEPVLPQDDPTGEGETIWEGNALLDWGNGLQLKVPASAFQNKGSDVRLVLSYTQDYTDYDDLQLFYGDWSSLLPFSVGSENFTGDFAPSNFYSTGSGTSHTTVLSFSESTLATILQKGVVVQGHGIRLNKVMVATPTRISHTQQHNPYSPAPAYTVSGMRTKHLQPNRLYIQNGRKFVAH